ncbi:hypothetical protein HPP92_009729 [Vanilla planifolia]|uniref:Uncharacterized protein n=1 Tax=Vanilla planifolia TaxID=51239 RepID=A0A835REU2_VANPL|nr:hypothetical protein HPP92_009729 [Vanilla planifolia]
MTYLCSADNLPSLLGLLLLDLLLLSSFLVSHPLLLVYLLLLSPYLLQLFFCFYPLLLSTCLLLLALPSVSSHLRDPLSTFLGHFISAVLEILQVEFDAKEAKTGLIEQLCSFLLPPEDNFNFCVHKMESSGADLCHNSGNNLKTKENPVHQIPSASQRSNLSGSIFRGGAGDSTKTGEDAAGHLIEKREERPTKEEENTTNDFPSCRKDHSRRPSEILQRVGSTRKEGEWRRSLACKLYEERMTYRLCDETKVVEGAVEMDLLWEAYEIDAHKKEKGRRKAEDANKPLKKEVLVEEEEDEEASGQLCCLQALRLSTGKMNIGMARPSLVKISMAFKGIASFRRTGRKSKKP